MAAYENTCQQKYARRKKNKTGGKQTAKQLTGGVKKGDAYHRNVKIEHFSLSGAIIKCGGQSKENHTDGKGCKGKLYDRKPKGGKIGENFGIAAPDGKYGKTALAQNIKQAAGCRQQSVKSDE